jgi:hypothetical protein
VFLCAGESAYLPDRKEIEAKKTAKTHAGVQEGQVQDSEVRDRHTRSHNGPLAASRNTMFTAHARLHHTDNARESPAAELHGACL